jgi:hypothetical protein
VVTKISEAVPFWAAEAEDQDYLQRYPNGYTCHFPPAGLEAATPRDRRLTGLKRYAGVRWTLDTACPGSARNRQSFSSLFALP